MIDSCKDGTDEPHGEVKQVGSGTGMGRRPRGLDGPCTDVFLGHRKVMSTIEAGLTSVVLLSPRVDPLKDVIAYIRDIQHKEPSEFTCHNPNLEQYV